jgi:hypothetical protein
LGARKCAAITGVLDVTRDIVGAVSVVIQPGTDALSEQHDIGERVGPE